MMKGFKSIVLPALVLALAIPASAEEGFQKCDKDFQTCINEIVKNLQTRGWIGISLSQIDDKIVVKDMAQDGPSRKGGFKVGDVIVALNGTKYTELDGIIAAHAKVKAGDVLTYKVIRDGKEQELDVLSKGAPANVIGLWIGEYILQHYVTVDGEKVLLP